jgi:hypothetical protein
VATRKSGEGGNALSVPSEIIFSKRQSISAPGGIVIFEAHKPYKDADLIALAIAHKLAFDTIER